MGNIYDPKEKCVMEIKVVNKKSYAGGGVCRVHRSLDSSRSEISPPPVVLTGDGLCCDFCDALNLNLPHNDVEFRSDPNISDVLEAISIADPPAYGEVTMYRQPGAPPTGVVDSRPYVRIVEQPAPKSLRFRYECEGRSAGSIPGVSSTPDRKSYPAIEVCGYKGRFVVLVSCVTKDKPYRVHPHNLVGREPMCSRGVCTVEMNGDSSVVTFSNLGIQCVKRKDIAAALKIREEMKVDPFKQGYNHKNSPQTIDLNAVRLCFQVFIPGENSAKIKHALQPVVSEVIYDKKAMCELQINRISTCAGSVAGGTEVILLCEKVTREDIDVTFIQMIDDKVVWEAPANVLLVHKQVAIVFQVPPYQNPVSEESVKVNIQLKRPSDQARSMPVPFEYTPHKESEYLNKKKRRMEPFVSTYKTDKMYAQEPPIKTEPRDASPALHIGSPHYAAPQFVQHEDPRYQQWQMPPMEQNNLNVPGASQNPYLWGPHNYGPPSPIQAVQSVSPNIHAMTQNQSPSHHAMSPTHRVSPNMIQNPMSPNMMQNQMSPLNMGMTTLHPMQGNMSPMGGNMSPMGGNMSPMGGNMSPMVQGNVSPNPQMQQQQPMPVMGMPMQMEGVTSNELASLFNATDRSDPAVLSADFSGCLSLLEQRTDLPDSLNQLSASDLYPVNQ